MSKELMSEILELNKKDLAIYKDIILRVYQAGTMMVPPDLGDKQYHINLARMGIIEEPRAKIKRGALEVESYFEIELSPKGTELAKKLSSEDSKQDLIL